MHEACQLFPVSTLPPASSLRFGSVSQDIAMVGYFSEAALLLCLYLIHANLSSTSQNSPQSALVICNMYKKFSQRPFAPIPNAKKRKTMLIGRR
ncbi:hypothetical protein VTL71DRAFT_10102 [Oculimacula yallundae]|uniref:Uncharacterized protein n=1 Tax=Oculimacula yallundae TaxID=86028 RepID=A0ABR4BQE1_9HELO